MSREVRRVPADWKHPKRADGSFEPLFDSFCDRLTDWYRGAAQWTRGLVTNYKGGWKPKSECSYLGACESYKDYAGSPPDPAHYMPDFPKSERTHWQMYETTSEGTPISPVCESPEELARWLADNGASSFGSDTATYDEWLAMIRQGWAPSAVGVGGHLESGVAFVAREEPD